jgi:hypothetical protein
MRYVESPHFAFSISIMIYGIIYSNKKRKEDEWRGMKVSDIFLFLIFRRCSNKHMCEDCRVAE